VYSIFGVFSREILSSPANRCRKNGTERLSDNFTARARQRTRADLSRASLERLFTKPSRTWRVHVNLYYRCRPGLAANKYLSTPVSAAQTIKRNSRIRSGIPSSSVRRSGSRPTDRLPDTTISRRTRRSKTVNNLKNFYARFMVGNGIFSFVRFRKIQYEITNSL